jgi:hypothetical protein
MTKLPILCGVLIMLVFFFAIKTAPAQAAFDPGQLVSDASFSNQDALSEADIQKFLQEKKSVLARLDPGTLGSGANGRDAAQIIYDATRATHTDFARSDGYGLSRPLKVRLNPQVLLATLQKEQSLVSGKYIPGTKATTLALRFATGYGCPAAGCDLSYAGFSSQVENAAAQLARNYFLADSSAFPPGATRLIRNSTGSPSWSQTSQSVTISNASTSALYQYTPYVYSGNYAFWTIWNGWFANSVPREVHGADGTRYLVYEGTRYPFDSTQVARDYGYPEAGPLLSAQEAALPLGSLLSDLLHDDDGLYIATTGTRHPTSSTAARRLAILHPEEVTNLSWVLAMLPETTSP